MLIAWAIGVGLITLTAVFVWMLLTQDEYGINDEENYNDTNKAC